MSTSFEKKGDLNLDNLYDIHIRFLKNCRTQLFLDPGAALIMKSIKRILAMIQQFCSIFEDFVVTQVELLPSFIADNVKSTIKTFLGRRKR